MEFWVAEPSNKACSSSTPFPKFHALLHNSFTIWYIDDMHLFLQLRNSGKEYLTSTLSIWVHLCSSLSQIIGHDSATREDELTAVYLLADDSLQYFTLYWTYDQVCLQFHDRRVRFWAMLLPPGVSWTNFDTSCIREIHSGSWSTIGRTSWSTDRRRWPVSRGENEGSFAVVRVRGARRVRPWIGGWDAEIGRVVIVEEFICKEKRDTTRKQCSSWKNVFETIYEMRKSLSKLDLMYRNPQWLCVCRMVFAWNKEEAASSRDEDDIVLLYNTIHQ